MSNPLRILQTLDRSPDELRAAFARARVPDVPEIRELFLAAQPKVLKLASRISN